MGKDNKEMLKTVLANQELIMKHLGITKGDTKEKKKEPVKSPASPAVKKTAVKQKAVKRN